MNHGNHNFALSRPQEVRFKNFKQFSTFLIFVNHFCKICCSITFNPGASQHSKSMACENFLSPAFRTSRASRSTSHCVFNYLQPVSTRKNLFSFSSFFFFLYSAVGEFFDIILLIMLQNAARGHHKFRYFQEKSAIFVSFEVFLMPKAKCCW